MCKDYYGKTLNLEDLVAFKGTNTKGYVLSCFINSGKVTVGLLSAYRSRTVHSCDLVLIQNPNINMEEEYPELMI